jgi:hypothetical protein
MAESPAIGVAVFLIESDCPSPEDAGTQEWSGLKSALSRELSRSTNKYYYAHLAMNAYVGNHIFWRGDTSFVPLE